MKNISRDTDYRTTILTAALAFLERHQGEHLGCHGELVERTIRHLVDSFNVDQPLALRLTCEAVGTLLEIQVRQRLDRRASGEYTAVITDPVRGCAWSVPVSMIYEHLIAAGHGKPLSLDN